MKKINKHIEIVRSNKTWLSSMSQVSCDAIYEVLARHYARVGVTVINDESDLENLVSRQPDLVFLGMKFIPNDLELGLDDPHRIWITDYLDDNSITYTGSGRVAHELELNKEQAKQRLIENNLKTSAFYVATQNKQTNLKAIPLTFPLFVKPKDRGGGLGVDSDSVANNLVQLELKVNSIFANFQSDSLIEEYLPGREFSVAILKNENVQEYNLMPLELIADVNENGERLLSGNTKSSNSEQVIEIADELTKQKVNELALEAFLALGARDYGRIDIRMNKDGIPHFLEANLLPSLISGYGSFPKACVLNIDLEYEQMILQIIRLAFARQTTELESSLSTLDSLSPLEPAFELA